MRKLKYIWLTSITVGILAIIPLGQANAYISPYFASRFNNTPSNIAGFQGMQVVAKDGTLYVSSYMDGVVYKVAADGTSGQIIAGIAGQGGYSPDGSIAAYSTLEGPTSIAVGNDGTVYIAEKYQHHIRAVLPNGILTTVAGNGNTVHQSLLTDAPDAKETPFNTPTYLKVGPDNNLYIYDSGIIRRILPDGSTDHVGGAYGAYNNNNPYVEGGITTEHSLMPGILHEVVPFDFDLEGNIYFASSSKIHKINKSDDTVHTFSTLLGGGSQTLEDVTLANSAIGVRTILDIDENGQLWSGGGSLNIGNAIQYVSLTDRIVKTAAGGGNIDISPPYSIYSVIHGSDLKLPYYIKSLSVDNDGQVYFLANYVDGVGRFGHFIGVLSTSNIKDTILPTIDGGRVPLPNLGGWNNTNVTVEFTCTDEQSGIASCSSPVTFNTDGANQSAIGTATDNMGNTATTNVSGINIDKTAPTATGAAISGWLAIHWANPNISANASDALSGVVGGEYYVNTDPGQGNGTPMTYSDGKIRGKVLISGGPGGWHTVYMRSKDAAGNWSSTTSVRYFYIP